jgi:hypothetical protein
MSVNLVGTSTSQPANDSSRRTISIVAKSALLFSIALWLLMFVNFAGSQVRLLSDYTYLYDCGAELLHPSLHDGQVALVDGVVRSGASDQLVYRAALRSRYCNNYSIASLSMYGAGRLLSRLGIVNAETDFSLYLIHAIYWGMLACGALIGVAALSLAIRARESALPLSVGSAVVIVGALAIAAPVTQTAWLLYQASPSPPADLLSLDFVWWRYLDAWMNVGPAYSVFGVNPRSTTGLLALAAFVLRWNDRRGVAYSIPILVSFVHQSTALILLAVLGFCDLVARPRVLLERDCMVPVALSLILIVFRERMLGIMNVPVLTIVLVVVAAGIAMAAATLMKTTRSAIGRLWLPISQFRDQTIARVPLPFADAALIMVVWVIIVPLIYALSRHDFWFRTIYLWSELPPRYVGMFQLPVIAGFLFPIWQGAIAHRDRAASVLGGALGLLAIVLAGYVLRGSWQPNFTAKAERGAAYEKSAARMIAAPRVPQFADEHTWYYLLAKKDTIGGDDLLAIFKDPTGQARSR